MRSRVKTSPRPRRPPAQAKPFAPTIANSTQSPVVTAWSSPDGNRLLGTFVGAGWDASVRGIGFPMTVERGVNGWVARPTIEPARGGGAEQRRDGTEEHFPERRWCPVGSSRCPTHRRRRRL